MIDPQAYSHEDFVQNPGKYVLFRTARIAEAFSSIPDLSVGRIVNIRYFATQLNKERGNVNMPVYQVWVDNHEDLKVSPTMVYACALEGFLL
jgi:hypothetical protein